MPLPRFPLLLIDTASRRPWVGVKTGAEELVENFSEDDASRSLFPLVAEVLDRVGLEVADLRGIAVCSGPGSMLSIRTAIAGIRAWQGAGLLLDCSFYLYSSLAAASRMEPAASLPVRWTVADARRNSWNALRSDGSEPQILENTALEALAEPVFVLEGFPAWTKTAAPLINLPYLPETLFAHGRNLDLLQPAAILEPLVLRPAEYAKWQPSA